MTLLFEDGRGYCPWCEQGTAFNTALDVHYAAPLFGGQYSFSLALESADRTGVLIYTCQHCEKSVVVLEHESKPSNNFDVTGARRRVMVAPAPTPRSLDAAAPEEVRSLFGEASTCEKAGAMRGAGVMYRAAVEELVKVQGATGKNLYEKIESLNPKLPADLIKDLHEARMLGNDSIHAGIVYSEDEVADVASLIEEAILVLYVQPAQKQAMRTARAARRTGPATTS